MTHVHLKWPRVTWFLIGMLLGMWIIIALEAKGQEIHHGMPTPVMEPPQSAPRVMRPDVREYSTAVVMAVPDAAERDQELQEEWEDCFDKLPVVAPCS